MNVAQVRPPNDKVSQARLVATRSRDERANPDLLGRLIAHLRGRGWVHRRQLRTDLNLTDDALRALARYSGGAVIGSSSRGYGLVRGVPVEHVHAWISESRSRSKEINTRVAEVYRVLNDRTSVPAQVATSDNLQHSGSDAFDGAA